MSFRKGEVIYKEKNHIKGIYCVSDGIVKVFKTGFDGKQQIIRFAKIGDIIGYRSVLSGEMACTSAVALTNVSLCYIPAEALFKILDQSIRLNRELLKLVCKELDEANSEITDIAQKNVRARLAETLVHLLNNFGADSNGFLDITLTREEISNIIGTAHETVIRLLSDFKNEGLIEINGRKISILNKRALVKIAG